MNIKQFFLISITTLFLGFFIGLIFGIFLPKKDFISSEKPSVQSVLDTLNKHDVYISRSLLTEQEAISFVEPASSWPSKWWGQEITMSSQTQADIGNNLSQINSEDIFINHNEDTIMINIDDPTILSITIKKAIVVSSQSGSIEEILSSDSEGFSPASELLVKDTKLELENDKEVIKDAKTQTTSFIRSLLSDTGYKIDFE